MNNTVILLILLCILNIHISEAQQLEWKSVGTDFAFYDYAFQDVNESIFSFGSSWWDSNRFRIVSGSGEEVYSDSTILKKRKVILADIDAINRIKLFTSRGMILQLDTQRNELIELDTIARNIDFNVGKRINNRYLLIGSRNDNGRTVRERVWLSWAGHRIEKTVQLETIGEPVAIEHNKLANEVVELYSSQGNVDVIKWNKLDSIEWSINLSNDSIRINNVLVHSSGMIYLVGYVYKKNITGDIPGLIICLDSTGEEVWRRTYYRPDEKRYLDVRGIYDIIEIDNGRIVVCGTDGIVPSGPSTNMLLMEIDTDGDVKWIKRQNIYGEGTSAHKLFYNDDMTITAVGTAGESDYGMPERMFAAKFSLLNTKVNHTARHIQPLLIFPNPTMDFVNVSLSTSEPYRIINLSGLEIDKGYTNGRISIIDIPRGEYYLLVGEKNRKVGKILKP